MLAALISNKQGLRRTGALVLLSLSALFGVGLFGAQLAAPGKFGCTFYGEDFVAEYAASRLILSGRGAAVYDVGELTEAQNEVLAKAKSSCTGGGVMAYGLAFLVPFFPLTLLPPRLAYYTWTGLTVALFLFGAWRLARAVNLQPWPFWLIALAFFPTVGGLLQAQVHGVQFVALVEFWLAQRRRAERSAGLWLSLQLVKPQFLPLLVLWALLQRRWRLLGWFGGAGLVWLGVTVWLAGGAEGVANYLRTVSERVVAPNAPVGVPNMVNWRALAVVWFGAGGLRMVGVVTVVFALLTVAWVLFLWWKWRGQWGALTPPAFLPLMAATLLVGYDTHIYSAVFLLAPLLLALVETGRASKRSGVWPGLLDFTLMGSSLAAMAFIPFVDRTITLKMVWIVLPWFLAAQVLIVGAVAILAASLFAPLAGTEPRGALLAAPERAGSAR